MLNISTGSYLGGGTSYNASGSYTRNATSANIRSMSRDVQAGYSADIELIQKYLKAGKTDKAIDVYEDLMKEVEAGSSNYRYQVNEAQIQSAIKTAYESTTGSSLVNTIEDNTSNSFWTGFKQSLPIIGLFCNDTSDAEALAKMTGEEVSLKDRVLEVAGWAVGTAVSWLALGPLKAAGTALGLIGKTGQAASGVGKALQFCGWAKKGADAAKVGKAAIGTAKAFGIAAAVGTEAVGLARTTDILEY